jgi:hypothetical protein
MGKGIEKIFRILDLAKKHLRAFDELFTAEVAERIF